MWKPNILATIGHTPLVKLEHLMKVEQLSSTLYAKVEFFNPGGSVKDRIAYGILSQALEEGIITPTTMIIEPTSGNTGIGLALVCAVLQLACVIVMPDTMSVERRKLITAYGAQLVLSEGSLGMQGAVDLANVMHEENPDSFIPSQFDNPVNALTHENTTALEILEDCPEVTTFVAGIGTGGTLCGTGRGLKKSKSSIQIIGVEPAGSPLITQGQAGPHKLQGIGANFIPGNYDPEVVDRVLTVEDEAAYQRARICAQAEGILVGISSGAALDAAIRVAKEKDHQHIVVLLPDTGQRYLSTDLF